MTPLVDVHCHLESDEFAGNLDDIVAMGRVAGVGAFITAAWATEVWERSQAVAERYAGVYFALGIHPWYVREGHLDHIESLAKARSVGACAIGEIGLDAKIDAPSLDLQHAVFEAQLQIAEDLDLPVVVHCRGAYDQLLRTVKRVGMPERGGLIHAFSGSVEIAERLMDQGFSFSMGGSLTYRNSKKRERVLRRIFPDHFMLETDSPDIPPVEARGFNRPNTPANILYNLKAAAETLGEPPETVAQRTTENALRLFGLDIEEI
jgi:TatD DNase family protein